jgi:poly-beta-1,6-N-acetyl-D-glucosamine synthase
MKILFFLNFGLLVYIFIGYPMLIGLLALFRPRITKKKDFLPTVSVLLPAYNEENRIGNKIVNLVALKYPKDKMEILVGSDGSTDRTNEIISSLPTPHLPSPARGEELEIPIRIFIFPKRRGKPSVLNDLAKEASGEILIFADCRQKWNENSLKNLTRNFSDGKIGVVSGVIKEEDGGFYRKYENLIREAEGIFDSVPGATGAIYAMRKRLFKPLLPKTILDDLILPMQAVRQGFRSILEPEAVAYDQAFAPAQEKIRKIRTLAGNFQAFAFHPWLLAPMVNPIWFQTFSHKFLRLPAPVFLSLLFFTNLLTWKTGPFFKILFLLQTSFLILGFIGKYKAKKYKILNIFTSFLELNWATVLGFRDFITGRQKTAWKKAEG